MSNNSIVTETISSDSIENDLNYLLTHSTIYDNYVVVNTLDMSQCQYSFENVKLAAIPIYDTARNKYKQLKLIINDEKIIVYPHIGSA